MIKVRYKLLFFSLLFHGNQNENIHEMFDHILYGSLTNHLDLELSLVCKILYIREILILKIMLFHHYSQMILFFVEGLVLENDIIHIRDHGLFEIYSISCIHMFELYLLLCFLLFFSFLIFPFFVFFKRIFFLLINNNKTFFINLKLI